jgi:hypothetical protein
MKKYGEFINEAFTADQKKYSEIVADLFYVNGLATHINYDTQGYLMVGAKFIYENTKDIFTENAAVFQKTLKFIDEMNGIAVQTLENNRGKKLENMSVDFTFDFRDMDNLDPYFISLLGINKYKL